MNFSKYLDILPEVRQALEQGRPVVALESTIISHGMPYPQNMETARDCERVIRENGAVPATIAILGGRLKVGLSDEDLKYMATGKDIVKCSRRDLGFVVAEGKNGATTVAATMIVAALAGIRVFATGGVGGVHRGAERTFDISADLQELAHTNVCVVSAGVKSILDIGLTLEYLETYGVPVIGFKTSRFPAFYTPDSGFDVEYSVQDEGEVARMLKAKWELGLQGGAIVGNPIPAQYAIDKDLVDGAIAQALKEADEQHISGKRITPFLLDRIKTITGGESLSSNIQLVLNNCAVAARIAAAYAQL
jgi:pseudouridine-5'-phosphate glycosidase